MPNKNCNKPQYSELMIINEWHGIRKVKGILCKSRRGAKGIKSNCGTMKRQRRSGKDNFSKSNFLTVRMD
jgi:hypothetical protein